MFGYAITHTEDASKLSDAADIDGSPLVQVVHADLMMLVSDGTPTTNEPCDQQPCTTPHGFPHQSPVQPVANFENCSPRSR